MIDWLKTQQRLLAASIALVAGALLSGCGGPAGGSAAAGTAGLPGASCGGGAAAGDIDVSMPSGGVQRTVIVHIPTGYINRTRVPLVLNLHGSELTAAAQEGFSGMDSLADTVRFVVAYPQAAIVAGSGYDWNIPGQPLFGGAPAPASAPDDVAFLTQVIHTLEARLCVDSTRIDVTGFSGGARMAGQLGCDLPTTIAAIAPVSGLRLPSPCGATRAVPVISFHGTGDPIDPYAGNGQPYWTYSVPVAATRWAAHDQCATSPGSTQPAPGVRLTLYTGCAGGAIVALYTLAGEGHEWPGGPRLPARDTRVLGPQSEAINADATMWQFFEAHPLPSQS